MWRFQENFRQDLGSSPSAGELLFYFSLFGGEVVLLEGQKVRITRFYA